MNTGKLTLMTIILILAGLVLVACGQPAAPTVDVDAAVADSPGRHPGDRDPGRPGRGRDTGRGCTGRDSDAISPAYGYADDCASDRDRRCRCRANCDGHARAHQHAAPSRYPTPRPCASPSSRRRRRRQ